ncbi:MAG: TIGR04282 family arsenosugar biosynthesis glycosyltransferase [Gammaproteobacteria bacterium]|nr:TIGR04282 family arsenosugar biosynthesis glycosyltransferase [Gammaproteobacteria bacterium]
MTFKYPDAVVQVFAKAPVAGEVNTRLIPDIGEAAATELQKELIVKRLENLNNNNLCSTQLWCAPDTSHAFFQDCKQQYDIELYQQQGTDLGERMSSAIEQGLENFKRVVLIGTDAPSLTVDHIEQAIKQLDGHDVVIGPAEDGGYVLVGMSRCCGKVFRSVPWGSDVVLEVTRDKIKEYNLISFELEPCWDIDRVEDYWRYKNAGDLC